MRSHKSPAVCFLACLSVIFISCPREGDRVQPRPEDASDVPQDSSEQDGSPIAMETDWPSPPADIPASDFLDESSLPDVDCCEGLLDSADELPVELCSLPCQIQADCAGLFPQASPCETPVCQLVEACAEKSPDMAYQCVLELTEPPECCIADIDCADNDPCTENEGCLANYCVWSPIVSPDCCPDPVLELDFDDGVWPQPIPPVQPSGSTTWSIVDSPCHEGMALYLGDSECRTYYNGQLVDCVPVDGIPCTPETEAEDCPLPLAQCDPVTNGCKPDPPPTTIVLSLRIADVEIPNFPDVALSFDIRTDLEPPFPGSPMQFDILRLHVEPEDSFPIEVFSTKDLFNTDGLCVTAGIDLWEFAGRRWTLCGASTPWMTRSIISRGSIWTICAYGRLAANATWTRSARIRTPATVAVGQNAIPGRVALLNRSLSATIPRAAATILASKTAPAKTVTAFPDSSPVLIAARMRIARMEILAPRRCATVGSASTSGSTSMIRAVA